MNSIKSRISASFLLSTSLLCFQLVATARAESIAPVSGQTTVIPITLTPVIAAAASSCDQEYPRPELEYKGSEDYVVDGKPFTRFLLGVTNYQRFPDALFQASPNLPACGANENSSRTWVDVVSGSTRLYGFCGLSNAQSLNSLWFGVPKGDAVPSSAQVVLNDRLCNRQYTSNTVKIVIPPPTDNRCDQEYPAPKLALNGTDQFERNGDRYIRYRLKITNRGRYPDEFFTALDNVPPCGNRDFASRTVADVLTSNGTVLNSFCAFTAPRQLRTLRFTQLADTPPPTLVHAQLTDRLCEKTYTSNSVRVIQPDPKIEVNCDDGYDPKQLENAIASATPGSTFVLQGNCPGNFTIPGTVDNITIDGLTSDGTKTVITSADPELPAVTVDGAQNVTFKNLVFTRSLTGIAFINGATGRLIKVDATENTNGIVIKSKSSVSADDITANFNKLYGIQILEEGDLTFTDLDGTKRVGRVDNPQLFATVAAPQIQTSGLTLIAADPAPDASAAVVPDALNCDMQALSNFPGAEIFNQPDTGAPNVPQGSAIYVENGALESEGCMLDLGNGLMAVGLYLISSSANLTGSLVHIHANGYGLKADSSSVSLLGSQLVVQANAWGVDAAVSTNLTLDSIMDSGTPDRSPLPIPSLLSIVANNIGNQLDTSTLVIAPGNRVTIANNVVGFSTNFSAIVCNAAEQAEISFENNSTCNGFGDVPVCANILTAPVAPYCHY